MAAGPKSTGSIISSPIMHWRAFFSESQHTVYTHSFNFPKLEVCPMGEYLAKPFSSNIPTFYLVLEEYCYFTFVINLTYVSILVVNASFSCKLGSCAKNLLQCYSRKWVTCVGESCVSTEWYQLQLGCVTSVSHQVAAYQGFCGNPSPSPPKPLVLSKL